MAPRVAILPPVPVPYREPLFERLSARGRLDTRVVYLSGTQPAWDQRGDWFPESHPYEAEVLRSRQRARAGRTPDTVPRGLGRSLAAFDPACVVSWEYGPATLRALAWCRRRGRALAVFSELTAHASGELSPLQRRLHRLVAPRVDGFVAASSAARARAVDELGADPGRVEVSLQSADLEPLLAAATRSSHEGPVRVLTVGRLVPDKNVGRLIEAFAEAAGAAAAELEICGAGPLEAELRATADRLRAPVRFRGYVAPGELPGVYAEADVLALVSEYEPFGVALREAAAAGLPLVCTRAAGAVGDIAREGENAFVVDPGQRGQIADALRRLIGDAGLRRRMSEASVAVTEATPLEADVEAFERAVLGAIERRPGGI